MERWDYKTKNLGMKEEVAMIDWCQANRDVIELFEEGPADAMYSYYPDGVYRCVITSWPEAAYFMLRWC